MGMFKPPGITPRFVKGKYARSFKKHPGFERGNDGRYESILVEPVPEFFSRPGDGILTAAQFSGVDNNAMIIFGRDRTGRGEKDGGYNFTEGIDETNSLGKGSYGDYMGAGAIDIVVGRMAPFPLSLPNTTVGPLFTTVYGVPDLLSQTLEASDGEFKGASFLHPGFAMDAARIYISQMSKVDTNFKIKRDIRKAPVSKTDGLGLGTVVVEPKEETPSSSITIKADKARIHARKDVKIVTGGELEAFDSQGEPIVQVGGVHLMAGNNDTQQQPIPLGNNLEACLISIIERISGLTTIITKLTTEQMKYNSVLSKHRHLSPFYGLECTPSLTGGPEGVKTVLNEFRYVVAEVNKELANMESLRSRFLSKERARNKNSEYINSRYNTTN